MEKNCRGVIFFNGKAIPVESCYLYHLAIPSGDITLIIRALEQDVRSDVIEALKFNQEPIYYFIDGNLTGTYEGYQSGFEFKLANGVYEFRLQHIPEKKQNQTVEYAKPMWVRLMEKIILRKARI